MSVRSAVAGTVVYELNSQSTGQKGASAKKACRRVQGRTVSPYAATASGGAWSKSVNSV